VKVLKTPLQAIMVTAKMWKSLNTLFKYLPYGMLDYNPSPKISLRKHPKFKYFAIIYFFNFSSFTTFLPIHISHRLLTLPLSLPLIAIHYFTLILAILATSVVYVFSLVIFRSDDSSFLAFKILCNHQIKRIGEMLLKFTSFS